MRSCHIFRQHHFNRKYDPFHHDDVLQDDATRRDAAAAAAAANTNPVRKTRKHVSSTLLLLALITSLPSFPAHAGQVGATITKAVTTSDLGVSVRTSVVKGAQLMDSLDGKWEKFSDKFHLGSERSKQAARPEPRVIPPLRPLNANVAQRLLELSDQSFLKAMGSSISSTLLQQEIDQVAKLVQVSFVRSGVELDDQSYPVRTVNAPQFNFATYVHYKAYSNIIVNQQQSNAKSFNAIRRDFERAMGRALLEEWKLTSTSSSNDASSKASHLSTFLLQTHQLATILVDNGLAAVVEEPTTLNADDWQDLVDGEMMELHFSVAVDGDATLNAQILLQEQGYRLYPNFARFAVQQMVQEAVTSSSMPTRVSVMDYYFDTDYNSDPEKFEVKEVLMEVSIESE
jgi:hypothetical protein